MRRRLEQAGLPNATPRTFWIVCGVVGAGRRRCLPSSPARRLLVIALAAFAVGLGLPRWVLGFLKARRKKKFTDEFANAIDVIVRARQVGSADQRSAEDRGARNSRSGGQRIPAAWSKA